MKKLLLIMFIFISVIYGQKAGARLEFLEDGHDFGNVQEGKIVEHIFNFINTGSDTLIIKDVSSSCGCTAAITTQNKIAPKEKGSIRVSFDTQGRMGQQTKIVYVTSNDIDKPSKTLMIKANIVRELPKSENTNMPKIQFKTLEHNFGKVAAGKVFETIFQFRNVGKANLEIKEVKTSCGCTAAILNKKTLKPDETGEIKVELDTTGREGTFVRTITVFSNDPENGIINLKVSADVVSN